MNQYKITYWHAEFGYRTVIIEAETEDEANKEFSNLLTEGRSVSYCKTELV